MTRVYKSIAGVDTTKTNMAVLSTRKHKKAKSLLLLVIRIIYIAFSIRLSR